MKIIQMKLTGQRIIWLLVIGLMASVVIYVANRTRPPSEAELRAIYDTAPDDPAVTKILIGLQVPGTAGYEAQSDAAMILLNQLARNATKDKHVMDGKPVKYVVQVIHDQAYEGGAQYAASRLVELKAAAVIGPALPKLNVAAGNIYQKASIHNYPFDISSKDTEGQIKLAFNLSLNNLNLVTK